MRRAAEAFSKAFVFVSAFAALWLQAWIGSSVWGHLPAWTLASVAAGLVLGRLSPHQTWGALVCVAPLMPAGVFAAVGKFPPAFNSIWFGATLGALASCPQALSRWQVRDTWRTPIAAWAMVSAISWPLAAWREIDFARDFDAGGGFRANALSGNGGTPAEVLGLLATVALAQLVGLLFFDRAMHWARTWSPDVFRRRVTIPAAVGIFVAAGFTAYQGFIDLHFLNIHQWPALGRAGGTLLDGDASGAMLGAWVAVFIGFSCTNRRALRVFGVAGALLCWAGLWMTGSRMALASGLLAMAGLGLVMWRGSRRNAGLAFLAVVVVATGVVLAERGSASLSSPLRRVVHGLPAPTLEAIGQFARVELFDRTGPYGTVSVRMMQRFPVGGVGLGTFETLFPDFAFERDKFRYVTDNAQSWYRSQLAELGLFGSLAWVVWGGAFACAVWKSRGGEAAAEMTMVKASLMAIGLVGLVSMPARNPMVAFSVWLVIVWVASRAGIAGDVTISEVPTPHLVSTPAWAIALLMPVVVGADLWRTGHGALRPANRAVATQWSYEYGLYRPETGPNGEAYRWTADHALAVAQLPRMAWLKIAIHGGPPDADRTAFGYELRVRGKHVATVDGTAPREWYIETYPYETGVQVEVKTTRAWHPSDYGSADRRTLGVMLDALEVVDGPPHGAAMVRQR